MHGRRSLSVDLKEFDPEIERTLKALRAQGKITNTFDIKMAEHPQALREYFTPNTYNSPVGNRIPEIEANHFEIKASTIQMIRLNIGYTHRSLLFPQQNNEQFHESWERFKELLRSCPHHEVPKWQQIQSFYSGLDEINRQMVDSSCGGTFLHKTADETWDLFENLSDNSQQHSTSSCVGTSRQIGNRGMYEVSQNVDLSLKVDALSKKFDQLLALNTLPTNSPNVQGVCAICSSPSHVIYGCPSASLFPEFVQEQVNVAQGFHRQNDPYSNTYNSGWRNHPNFS
ncbi:hypothetical protein M9H77_26598 [Catharanthus roseus]|uniref:Uncharacterized protein n=1 Tax=Catharanthus roseus TaxID=4058 RepID=A0ACC0AAA2_CATRO|nr:hypothetical protein M9H77_26598 [Catharanthus roseus]